RRLCSGSSSTAAGARRARATASSRFRRSRRATRAERSSKRAAPPSMRSNLGSLLAIAAALAVAAASPAPRPPPRTAARRPVRIYGNAYYVGTEGLASVLITSAQGHVLIDGGAADGAPLVAASIEKLGFALRDVKAIVGSHAHYDHVGGIAELRRLTGATVY